MHRWDTLIKILLTILLLSPFAYFFGPYAHRGEGQPKVEQYDIVLPQSFGSTPAQIAISPDPDIQFILEAYDKAREIHWKKRTEGEMLHLFLPAYADAISSTTKDIHLDSEDRLGFVTLLVNNLAPRSQAEKRRIAVAVVSGALLQLEPLGRNRLMSKHEEVELRQLVSNIDPHKDLYADIGVEKGASQDVVTQKFEAEKVTLGASSSPEAKAKLEKITYAHAVLSNTETKARYDTALIEPTVFSHEIGSTMLYIYVSKIAPTTMEEFREAIARASTTEGLNHLTLDLRGNIGGALDFPLSFFGAYLGASQPAMELLHQDETWTEQTLAPRMPELGRFKKQIVLTDRGTQSTAEVVAAMFKKKKLALLVGDTTAGWGTVENTFPMVTSIDPSTTYALFLVHSLTVGDTEKPIQGAGVVPDVNVTAPGWEEKIIQYFGEKELPETLRGIMLAPPER